MIKKVETVAGVAIIAIGLGYIASLMFPLKPVEPVTKLNMAICEIIIPHGKIAEGWKFWDPAEDGNISNLLRDGKAEIDHLPGLVECTLYPDNQTPVTTSSALAMWRKK